MWQSKETLCEQGYMDKLYVAKYRNPLWAELYRQTVYDEINNI